MEMQTVQWSPLQRLWHDLRYFDWFHEYSESSTVVRDGGIRLIELRKRAESLPGGIEMFHAMRNHFFTGDSFGTKKTPMPERPAE